MAFRRLPFCFTEQGLTMLSCILNSDRAVLVNIHVIRVFTKLRKTAITQKEILIILQKLEKKIGEHDNDLKMLFAAMKQLLNQPQVKRRKIGYRLSTEDPEVIIGSDKRKNIKKKTRSNTFTGTGRSGNDSSHKESTSIVSGPAPGRNSRLAGS
jgi:hypothetical protein